MYAALKPAARIAGCTSEETVRRCLTEIGAFDYLVVTLGTQAVTQPFAQLAEEQLNQAFQERLLNYARVLRVALDFVRESVSWLTGAAARTVIPGLSNYSQASGALHAMIGQLALELAPVRINCAALGLTRTKVWDHLGMSKEAQAAMYANAEKSLLLIHVAAPKENAHALFFGPPVPTLQSLYST